MTATIKWRRIYQKLEEVFSQSLYEKARAEGKREVFLTDLANELLSLGEGEISQKEADKWEEQHKQEKLDMVEYAKKVCGMDFEGGST